MHVKTFVALVRCKHWIKNVLVFFPLVFDRVLFAQPGLTCASAFAFLAFCFASSAVYVFNDLQDVEKDRLHPTKRNRPIASGAVTKTQAAATLVVMVVMAAIFGALAAGSAWDAWACLAVYVVTNVLYSKGLKRVPVLDVTILASGFFLRVLYGALVTDIAISTWLYLTVFALSFYLGLGKRRNEVVNMAVRSADRAEHADTGTNETQHEASSKNGAAAANGVGETREVLAKYPRNFLESNMTVFFALGLVFYSLWATDGQTIARTSENVIWTIPLVFVICLRYSFLVNGESSGDPVEVVFKDKVLLCLMALFVAAMLFVIYAPSL